MVDLTTQESCARTFITDFRLQFLKSSKLSAFHGLPHQFDLKQPLFSRAPDA